MPKPSNAALSLRMGFSRRAALAAVVCLLAGLSAVPATAQQETPREVKLKAQMALAQGAFADAIGFLQKLVEWYGDSTKEQTKAQMESVYYNLGSCHFFIGQFSEAREVFEGYLKKYRMGTYAPQMSVYIGDSYRFEGQTDKALRSYQTALKKYQFTADLKADIYAAMARCYVAEDKWDKAMPVLRRLYIIAPDFSRRNWAATLLTTAYLKEMKLERVYQLIPYLLLPDSFASRSVALNMAALEAGDALFAEEKYRDALWIYRLVYPQDVLVARGEEQLEKLQKKAERLKRIQYDNPRPLMRVQESIGELENEIKAMQGVQNYDVELSFRIARAYMEIFRYREARDVFLQLYGQTEGRRAEECLYLAFQCTTRLQPWDQALELGQEYMKLYPAGEFYDTVSLMVGQIYAKLEDWANVIAVLTKALEVSPKHADAAECMFLIGYASFMEEKFPEAADWLKKMNKDYPGNPREADGTYWTGMALMFDRKFGEAAPEFDMLLRHYPDSTYTQDASFRRAVCDFGTSKYRDAEKRFLAFVARYPDHKLSGEAYMMLGDISGFFGELKTAVERYQQVPRYDVNIEFYNYSSFRCGEILKELGDFEGMISHFKEYMRRNREGSNVPLAMYWVGDAMWSMGDQKGALDSFRQGVEKYGVDRKELGTDMILEEWIGKGHSTDTNIAQKAWRDLADLLRKAETAGQTTLALRLKRVSLFQPGIDDARRQALIDDLLREENITNASPGVLEVMLEEARKRTNTDLAVKVAETTVKDFTETDYALSARMFLAQQAIASQDYRTAIRHLGVVKEVYASRPEAAEALILLGDLYTRTRKYADAEDCFKKVLAVREWRGPLWPQALYGLGESQRIQRKYDEASAYFERIYIMYGNYRQWAAKAYLARAECLSRLQEFSKAADTLNDMLANAELAELPEAKDARDQLESLKKRLQ